MTRSPDPSPRPEWVSITEAAAFVPCSTRTIRRRLADGSLKGYRFGPRLIRLDLVEVEAAMKPVGGGSR